MNVTLSPIEPAYTQANGLTALHLESVKFPPAFTVKTRSLVVLPPGAIGGNHRHPRQECFIGIGTGLSIAWRDTAGIVHDAAMNPGGALRLCHVPSGLPHAIINRGSSDAVLYELADASQTPADVQPVEVIVPR